MTPAHAHALLLDLAEAAAVRPLGEKDYRLIAQAGGVLSKATGQPGPRRLLAGEAAWAASALLAAQSEGRARGENQAHHEGALGVALRALLVDDKS